MVAFSIYTVTKTYYCQLMTSLQTTQAHSEVRKRPKIFPQMFLYAPMTCSCGMRMEKKRSSKGCDSIIMKDYFTFDFLKFWVQCSPSNTTFLH